MEDIQQRLARLSPQQRAELSRRLRQRPGSAPAEGPGDSRLVAYVVATTDAPLQPAELRRYLEEQLPGYLVPSDILLLESLPLTPSGKVDRLALPSPGGGEGDAAGAFVAPRTWTEELLAGIWSELLGARRVSADANFFEVGGHSLLATRVMSRVRQAFGVDVPLRTLFEHPVLSRLALQVEALCRGSRSEAPPLIPSGHEAPRALSFAQERLWVLEQLQPLGAAYNVPCAVRLSGALDVGAMERALNALIQRHEVLRATFPVQDGKPRVQLLPELIVSLVPEDVPEAPAGADLEERARELATEEARRPFDLEQGPLLRARLFRLAPTEHLLLFSLHHIIADGWSVGLLVRDVAALYGAGLSGGASSLPPLPVQYGDFARWQREWLASGVLEKQLEYWRAQLAGAPAALQLPTSFPRPAVQGHRGAHHLITLPEPLTARLESLGRREGATLFMTLLAAFHVLLGRYSGQRDVVVGSSIAGRTRAEVEDLIGLFINALALRVDQSGDPPFTTLLRRVKEVALAAYAHQDVPFEKLVAELRPERDLSRTPFFQVLFELHTEPPARLQLTGLSLTPLPADTATAKFDLSLELTRTAGGLSGLLEYNTELFSAAAMERLARHLHRLLESIVEAPGQRLSALSLLEAPERRLLLDAARAPDAANAFARTWRTGYSLRERFEHWVRATPDAVAAVDDTRSLTYAQLDAEAENVARGLAALGVGQDALVGLFLDRSVDFLVGLLGVFKAGAAYVPLDPKLPSARLEGLVAQAACAALLTEPRYLDAATGLGVASPRVRCVAELAAQVGAERVTPVHHPRELAYLFFTSGSTGTPKGAMVEQEGMLNHLAGKIHDLGLTAADSVVQNASQSFDISVWQFLVALVCGGRTRVVSDQVAQDPFQLLRLVAEERITVLELVPSLLRGLLEGVTEAPPALDSLRWLVVTGEALPPELCRHWLRLYPRIPIVNAYGPTECSDDVTHHFISEPPAPGVVHTPVGRPLPELRVHVLDERLEPTPWGVSGHVYVGGVGVGRGYRGDAGKTAHTFLPDPYSPEPGARLYRTGDLGRLLEDGAIEFLGRIDHQVKLRGFRIELGEIESVLSESEKVLHATVMLRGTGGQARLVAYVVARPGTGLTGVDLQHALRQRLPEYMVPAAFVFLEAMPLLSSGKVNMHALPPPPELVPVQTRTFEPPRTPTEQAVARVWEQLLETPRVGREDNFFELGGHSLVAVHTVSRVRRVLGVELPVRALFEEPTVSGVARRIDLLRTTGAGEAPSTLSLLGVPVEVLPPRPEYELSPYQLPELYMKQLDPDNPYYNVSNSDIQLTGDLDLAAFTRAWEALCARHEAFRTTFHVRDGRPVQCLHPARRITPEEIYIDRTSLPEHEVQAEAARLSGHYSATAFDFERGPIHVLKLVEFPGKRYLLIFATHHILWDERCTMIVARELTALYNAFRKGRPDPLLPLEFKYVDFARWILRTLDEGRLEAQRRYWLEQLSPLPQVLELPTDRERPAVQTYNGATVTEVVRPELFQRVEGQLQRHQVTLYMYLLAVLDLHLFRLTGQTDFAVGTPVANRTDEAFEDIIGCFATALPMRCRIDPGMSFTRLLAQAREASLQAYDNQTYPSILAIQELNPAFDLSRNRLFSVMYGLQNNKTRLMEHMRFDGLKLDFFRGMPTPEFDRSKFDFTLVADQFGQELVLQWNYNTDLFHETTARRMLRQFMSLLEQVVAEPERALNRYRMLDEAERAQLVRDFNATALPVDLEGGVQERFEAQAARTPDAPALVSGGRSLSYRELNGAANRLAHRLLELGTAPEEKVAVLLDRSPEQIIALLAIWKAGGAYVPVSPELPAERQREILERSGARRVVTTGGLAPGWSGKSLLIEEPLPTGHSEHNPRGGASSRRLAYVLFTSGTTGVPKGIEIEHRGVLNLLASTQAAYGLTARDRVLFTSSFAFDASLLELYWPLSQGAAIIVPGADEGRDPEQLLSLIERHAVTVFQGVPLMLGALLDARRAGTASLDSLRLAICGGSYMERELRDRFLALVGHCALVNHYGPTEVTVDATHFDCRRDFTGKIVPIGRPIANTRVYVLDASLSPVPLGVTGELYVASPGLARGYLGEPGRTAERFLPDPFSVEPGGRMYRTGDLGRYREGGVLDFVGRTDKQVKVRGNRVELEEVEAHLTRHPAVAKAVVRHEPLAPGGGALVAFVELAEEIHALTVGTERYRLFTLSQRPELRGALDALHLEAWPAFFEGDAVMRRYWPRLADEFPQCQFLLVDERDQAVAAGNALPLCWDGTREDLPAGWDAGLERGFLEAERGEDANTLLMLTGVVDARAQGTGLSQVLLNLFKAVARGHGFERVIVPVRPTGKAAHPELTFAEWCARRRPDGLVEDPWLRSHERVGGQLLRLELKSQRVEGSLEDWERWTGQTFPASGEYALTGALQPLRIDLETRTGLYEDPSVWMEHVLTGPLLPWTPVEGPVLREFLRRSLPEYMVPEYYRVLGRMPLGDSGKVDERALPRALPARALRARALPPRTPVQERLAAIWKAVLEVEQLGIEDDFFELGGHSIRAVRMLAKVKDAFGVAIPMRRLFTARTIETLAPLIEAAVEEEGAAGR